MHEVVDGSHTMVSMLLTQSSGASWQRSCLQSQFQFLLQVVNLAAHHSTGMGLQVRVLWIDHKLAQALSQVWQAQLQSSLHLVAQGACTKDILCPTALPVHACCSLSQPCMTAYSGESLASQHFSGLCNSSIP